MKTFVRAAALCLLFAPVAAPAQTGPAAPAAAPAPTNAQALAGFDRYVEETLAAWEVPGVAISIVRNGEVVLNRGYGVRDPDGRAPMTRDTIFPIASMSKAFTSFGAGLLVDDGRMSFDAPVVTYLPALTLDDPAATSGLTLRDMLSHRSGMPRHDAVWYHNAALTRDQLLGRMPHLAFSAPLRARFQYNNIMFVLSGLAIERVGGEEWERFTERRIFGPLGMDRTMFSPQRAAADPNHSKGREVLNGRQVTVPLFRNTPILNPAGGVYSTADDLASWMLVHLDGGEFRGRRIIQPSTLADIHRTQMASGATVRDPEFVPIGYGLGWFTDIYRGRPMVEHGGNLPGVSTLVALLPGERLGVTVLVNHGGSELRDALARAIIDRFLGASGKDWVGEALARKRAGEAAEVAARQGKGGSRVAGTQPSHPLADLAGSYAHPGYGPLTVRLREGALTGTYNDDTSPLSHWHYDVFDATTQDPENALLDSRIQFVSDFYGRISGVRIAIEPAVEPALFERQPEARLSDPAFLARLAGTYELAGNRILVSLAGDRLTWLSVGGQPAALLPALGGEFTHARRRDARIVFVTGASGPATALQLIDSSGVYEARRVN
jgi:CubicO group peptidase (beta-lactamase class C family)